MAINLSNLKLSFLQLFGYEPELLLLHAKDWCEYKDGKITTNRLGTQYEVIENGGDFNRFWVKVADTEPYTTEEEIASSKERVTVTFKDAVCTLYVDNTGHIQVSVKASGVDII